LGTITEESSSSSSPSGGGSSSGSTSGGAGTTTPVECFKDSQCQQDYVCYQQKCVKLFDVKIIEVDSPIGKDGFLDFTYFLKGMANINSDVIVDFWLERGGERISSGKDTIYLGEFEEKTESTQIYIPKDLETGEYQFHVQVSFENYQAVSFRTVYVEQKEEEIEVILIEEPEIQKPFDLFLFTALLLFLIMIILLTVLHWKREVWIKKIKIIKVIQFNHLWKKVKQLIKEIKLYLIKKINVPTTAESIVVKPKKESKRVVRKSKVKKKKVIKKKVVKKLDKESYQRKFNSGMLKAVLSKPKKPAAKNKLINPLKEEELYKRKFIGGLTAAILRKKTKKK